MTRRQTCGELPPAAERNPYCSVCNELQNLPDNDYCDVWLAAVGALYDRLDRLTRHRTLYHRRHRRRW